MLKFHLGMEKVPFRFRVTVHTLTGLRLGASEVLVRFRRSKKEWATPLVQVAGDAAAVNCDLMVECSLYVDKKGVLAEKEFDVTVEAPDRTVLLSATIDFAAYARLDGRSTKTEGFSLAPAGRLTITLRSGRASDPEAAAASPPASSPAGSSASRRARQLAAAGAGAARKAGAAFDDYDDDEDEEEDDEGDFAGDDDIYDVGGGGSARAASVGSGSGAASGGGGSVAVGGNHNPRRVASPGGAGADQSDAELEADSGRLKRSAQSAGDGESKEAISVSSDDPDSARAAGAGAPAARQREERVELVVCFKNTDKSLGSVRARPSSKVLALRRLLESRVSGLPAKFGFFIPSENRHVASSQEPTMCVADLAGDGRIFVFDVFQG